MFGRSAQKLHVAVAAAVLTLSMAGVAVPASAPALAPPSNAAIQQLLDAQIHSDPGTGIIVGILDRGRTTILKAGSSGTARPLDEHSLFEIGSVTKTFTATILADMVLHHEVDLDAPVEPFLPAGTHVPARNGKAVTFLTLATQHSGLPRMPDNMLQPKDPTDPYADYTWDKLAAFLGGYTLTRDPGATFEYSNLGAAVLGNALAGVARTSYSTVLQARVLGPLGMNETSVLPVSALAPALRERVTVGHAPDDTVAPAWNFDSMAPAGAIRSSVSDMLRYVRCNLGAGPLATDCLFAQQPRDTLTGNAIGLIWWTGDVVPIVRHSGDTAGFHACVAVAPDHQRGVVVLSSGSIWAGPIAEYIIDAALTVPQTPLPITLAPGALDAYAGTYHNVDTRNRNRIVRDGNGLTMQVDGLTQVLPIYPLGSDRFVRKTWAAQLTFTRDASGDVDTVRVRYNGRLVTYVRDGKTPPATPAAFPPTVTLDDSVLAQYAGTYIFGADATFTVRTGGESGLTVQLTGQPALPLYASAKDHFFLKIVDAQVEFTRDAAGNVAAIVNHQNGHVTAANRLR
jgi:D-alanyl-D-alanine-carboxypeptidase/D-alanyl-D-alanine-endopeptidase